MDALAPLFILGGFLLVVWWASLTSHPYTNCARCQGRGYYRHPVFVWATKPCKHCQRGIVRRFGAKKRWH